MSRNGNSRHSKNEGDGLAKFRIFHFLHDTKTAGCKLRLNLNTQFLIAAFWNISQTTKKP
jgi:hypothetical protein